MARAGWAGALVIACSAALACGSQACAEDKPLDTGEAGRAERPRDAAQAVQEGSVTQWLEHYQRERGEGWAKSKAAGGAAIPEAPLPPAGPPRPAAIEK